ncbi:MAG: signal peptidase I [Victivallaceae bacterium]|nr:signal peptidase I [Victivallaceae bacterium]
MFKQFTSFVSRLFYELKPKSAHDFFIPRLTRIYLIRIAVIILLCFTIFGFVLRPAWVKGGSMEPTYRKIGLNFIYLLKYWHSKPQRGDIVAIYYEKKVMFLKRIVALPDETVEFRDGKLYVNGQKLDEPYVKKPCDWELPPRTVQYGYYYVVGDNRNQPIERHQFGQVAQRRIIGVPLW